MWNHFSQDLHVKNLRLFRIKISFNIYWVRSVDQALELIWARGSKGAIVITHNPSLSLSVGPYVHNFFKGHLFINHWTNFNGDTEWKMFVVLVRNHWADFNIIWQKCSFSDINASLFKNTLNLSPFVMGFGSFTYTHIDKILNIFMSVTRNPWPLIFGMKLYLIELYKIVQIIAPESKLTLHQGITCFTYSYRKKIKNLFVRK